MPSILDKNLAFSKKSLAAIAALPQCPGRPFFSVTASSSVHLNILLEANTYSFNPENLI
jgi:hypothetical protein